MERPEIAIQTGTANGEPVIAIIPDGNIADMSVMGLPELIEQVDDLELTLSSENYLDNADIVSGLSTLLKASNLLTNAADLADELNDSGLIAEALLIDTVLAVLQSELGG